MPRVTDEYLVQRRAEILRAAARCFARDGFHATSMAAIIAEAGLSAGAVYRYFRSKDEIIVAAAEWWLAAVDEWLGDLLADGAAPSPEEAVAQMAGGIMNRTIIDSAGGVDLTRIALQVWSEALRQPALAAQVDVAYRRLRGHCAEVARRWQAAGNLSPEAVPEQVGAAMFGLLQGFIVQRLLVSDTTPEGYLAGVHDLLAGSGRRSEA
ncbi:TetR/AcrR family transcriptional regulator [Hamadaea tsunoensis]|uniref:TetR/AcrR family transcriptional regulator n=1 Tax=Hamadaea tsunoensis TaxID=53368 RepID=UPI0003F712A6|nr:TetR/AcrR family transcriptional regulator [Hamadaea tsunoensis]